MPDEVFVDSGAWIAVSIASDHYHATAVRIYQDLLLGNRVLVTSNLVIAESFTLIRRAGGLRPATTFLKSLHNSTRLTIVYSDEEMERRAWELIEQFADQDFSYVDAVSFSVMRTRRIAEAFAFDRHFVTAGFNILAASTD